MELRSGLLSVNCMNVSWRRSSASSWSRSVNRVPRLSRFILLGSFHSTGRFSAEQGLSKTSGATTHRLCGLDRRTTRALLLQNRLLLTQKSKPPETLLQQVCPPEQSHLPQKSYAKIYRRFFSLLLPLTFRRSDFQISDFLSPNCFWFLQKTRRPISDSTRIL